MSSEIYHIQFKNATEVDQIFRTIDTHPILQISSSQTVNCSISLSLSKISNQASLLPKPARILIS